MEAIIFALFGAFVGGFLTFLAAERTVFSRSVIDERAKWRDKIRDLTIDALEAFSRGDASSISWIRAEFETRLNPKDRNDADQKILEIFKQSDPSISDLLTRVSILLKHDWERAKIEASLAKSLCFLSHRPSLEELQNGDNISDDTHFRKRTWLGRRVNITQRCLFYRVLFIIIIAVPIYYESIIRPIYDSYRSGLSAIRCDSFDRCSKVMTPVAYGAPPDPAAPTGASPSLH